MKPIFLILLLAASAAAASAQGPVKAAAPAATPTKPASTAAKSTAATAGKLPPGIPVYRVPRKTEFSLQYQDVKIGTGAEAEPNKLYKVHYTGWRAADGVKFDSSYDHPGQPLKDKDGKPVLGPDGKAATGPAQPYTFPQGMGGGRGPFPGFDQGFEGMKVGGKRRLFVPWELAYGNHAIPDRGVGHPGIPAKSDLIFDVELVDMTDMPAQPNRPGMPPGAHPMPGAMPPHPGAPPAQPGKGAAAPPTAAPGAPATPATSAKPATPPGSPSTPPAPATTPAPSAPAAPATPPANPPPSH
ncbi:MAG: FKBP-type peptidyl-prolyl cis-trans isomerase [Terracidiphilus sp.]|jgi:peptidylprolyl isomerase